MSSDLAVLKKAKKGPDLSLYPDPHQNFMGSILGRDQSSIHPFIIYIYIE